MDSYEKIKKNSKPIVAKNNLVAYELFDENEKLIVIFNGSAKAQSINIEDGTYSVLINKKEAKEEGIEVFKGNEILVESRSAIVLKKK